MQVKPRFDDKGSEFGAIHRCLPSTNTMFDIDRVKVTTIADLEINGQDTCFMEYRQDWNTYEVRFAAMFEVKHKVTPWVKKAANCEVGSATYAQLKMCEKLNCRYFFVVATHGEQPFHFYEIFYDMSRKYLGALKYTDKDIDGPQAINDFWNNILKIN